MRHPGPPGCARRARTQIHTRRQAVVGRFLQDFRENPGKMVNTILQMYPVGPDGVCVIGDSHVGTNAFSDDDPLCAFG